jgi:hypothetical protein
VLKKEIDMFSDFEKELPKYCSEPSTFEKEFDRYIQRIRGSPLTSQQILRLRDSIDTGPTTHEGAKLRAQVRGQLQHLYEERLKGENEASKPWLTRLISKHPVVKVLFWFLSVILSGIIGFYPKEILRGLE